MFQRIRREIGAVVKAWGTYECTSLSASIAFYAALSLVPFILTLVAGFGVFFEFFQSGQDAREQVLATLASQFSPQAAESVDRIVEGTQHDSLVRGPLAAVVFLLTASLVFAQIDRGFERIWEVRRRDPATAWWRAAGRIALRRLRSLALMAAWGFLVLLVFMTGFFIRTLREAGREWFPDLAWSGGIEPVLLGLVVNFAVFTTIYKLLSKEKVGWLLPLRSGLIAALLWEVGSKIVASLAIGDKFTAYGLAGSFLAILLWIYYNAMVLFLGALLIRVRYDLGSGLAAARGGGSKSNDPDAERRSPL